MFHSIPLGAQGYLAIGDPLMLIPIQLSEVCGLQSVEEKGDFYEWVILP